MQDAVAELKELLDEQVKKADEETYILMTKTLNELKAIKTKKGRKGYKSTRIWDNYKEVARIECPNRALIIVGLCARNGARLLSIGRGYTRKSDGEVIMKTSINIQLEDMDPETGEIMRPLDEFVEALNEAIAEINDFELWDEENARWTKAKW